MTANKINLSKMAKDIGSSSKYLELILKNNYSLDLYELKEIHKNHIKHESAKLILVKWKKIALKKARSINSIFNAKNVYENSPSNSKAQKIALRRWRKYSKQEIFKADTFSKIQQAYESSPPNSKEKEMAFLKWVKICQNCAEIMLIFINIKSHNSKKNLVLEKWYRLAKTKHEIKDLYNYAIGTNYEIKALKKLSLDYEL